jgi:hypothetical protein
MLEQTNSDTINQSDLTSEISGDLVTVASHNDSSNFSDTSGDVQVSQGNEAEITPGNVEVNQNIKRETITDTSEDSATGTEDVEVYRFFNTDLNLQFYTTSEFERDSILENLPQYKLEGVPFIAAPEPTENDITGVSPVYRLFNSSTGVHLYTVSEVEKNYVVENLSNYTLEGVAYYGYDTQQEGTTALYRFYNSELDAHFYTASAEERDSFLSSSDYQLEGNSDGIAFYVEAAPEI